MSVSLPDGFFASVAGRKALSASNEIPGCEGSFDFIIAFLDAHCSFLEEFIKEHVDKFPRSLIQDMRKKGIVWEKAGKLKNEAAS